MAYSKIHRCGQCGVEIPADGVRDRLNHHIEYFCNEEHRLNFLTQLQRMKQERGY